MVVLNRVLVVLVGETLRNVAANRAKNDPLMAGARVKTFKRQVTCEECMAFRVSTKKKKTHE